MMAVGLKLDLVRFWSSGLVEMSMFSWDFEVVSWLRFWRWNLSKLCVRTHDMTSRSYFGKMNSTLGSVVPLAMFHHWALLKTRIRGFHANFHFAALTSPLQLLLVLCPPPLSFELASSALCWLVVSVAPQIEHMFDLGSTRSTPFKYQAPVATWDRLHI